MNSNSGSTGGGVAFTVTLEGRSWIFLSGPAGVHSFR